MLAQAERCASHLLQCSQKNIENIPPRQEAQLRKALHAHRRLPDRHSITRPCAILGQLLEVRRWDCLLYLKAVNNLPLNPVTEAARPKPLVPDTSCCRSLTRCCALRYGPPCVDACIVKKHRVLTRLIRSACVGLVGGNSSHVLHEWRILERARALLRDTASFGCCIVLFQPIYFGMSLYCMPTEMTVDVRMKYPSRR